MFKKCPMCAAVWLNRDQFLRDRRLELNGYQADFDNIENGLFFFTHNVASCFSTMGVMAGEFFDLNPGVRFSEKKKGSEECPGYCLKKDDLDSCGVRCECAFVRDVISIIQKYKGGDQS